MSGRRDDARSLYSLFYSEKCPFLISKWACFLYKEAIQGPCVPPPCHSQPWLYSYTALYIIQLYSAIQYTCYTPSL